MPESPLKIIEDVSAAHHARPINFGADHAILDVAPPSVSGAPGPIYRLRIDDIHGAVAVREAEPAILPACCPERHINCDGSFCMYWQEAEPLSIESADSALRRRAVDGLPSPKGGLTAPALRDSN
jgi:hypothetical protein